MNQQFPGKAPIPDEIMKKYKSKDHEKYEVKLYFDVRSLFW